jgi:hypothetical protein
MNKLLDKLCEAWYDYNNPYANHGGLRFGQYFINNYVVGSYPSIYYEKGNEVAYTMIYNEILGGNLQSK